MEAMQGSDSIGAVGVGGRRRAVFLDRDGTLIQEKGYLRHPSEISFVPGAPEAVRRLNQAGLPVVLVTNQSGIARGYFSLGELEAVHAALGQRLAEQGARLDAVHTCPHHPEGKIEPYARFCPCRKPGTGMLEKASLALGISLPDSYLVGDKIADMEAARRVGSTGILVHTGYGRQEWATCLRSAAATKPDRVARDLTEAVRWILSDLDLGRLRLAEDGQQAGEAPRWSCKWSSLAFLKKQVVGYRKQGKTLVLTNGVFDLLHVGHVGYLAAAKALGDVLIVAVNDDGTAAALKGPGRPVTPVAERVEVLSALTCVDHCLVFFEGTVDRVLEELRPEIHAKGTDYREHSVPERETVLRYGGRVRIVGPAKVRASTDIIARLRDKSARP